MSYSEDQLRLQAQPLQAQPMQAAGSADPDRSLALIQNMQNVTAMERQQARAKAHSDALRGRLEQPTSGASYANLARGVLDGLRVGYDRRQQLKGDERYAAAMRDNTQQIANALLNRGQPQQQPQPQPNVMQQPMPDPY